MSLFGTYFEPCDSVDSYNSTSLTLWAPDMIMAWMLNLPT